MKRMQNKLVSQLERRIGYDRRGGKLLLHQKIPARNSESTVHKISADDFVSERFKHATNCTVTARWLPHHGREPFDR